MLTDRFLGAFRSSAEQHLADAVSSLPVTHMADKDVIS